MIFKHCTEIFSFVAPFRMFLHRITKDMAITETGQQ